jgi:hypothetical protein
MKRKHIGWVVFHAGAIVLGACLAGLPYYESIKAREGLPQWFAVAGTPSQWSLAHSEGIANAVLMAAATGATARLTVSDRSSRVLCWSLVLTGWGNFAGSVLAALRGDDSYRLGFRRNAIAFGAFGVAAAGAVVAATTLIRIGLANRHAEAAEVQTTDTAAELSAV